MTFSYMLYDILATCCMVFSYMLYDIYLHVYDN